MKILLYIVGALVLFGLVIFGMSLIFGKNEPAGPSGQGAYFPVASSTTQDVNQDFTAQIQNAGAINLENAVIVSDYALQNWGDENKGGQALLKFDTSTGKWNLLSMGGGAWDVDSLVAEGVPASVAEELITKSQ